MILSLLLLTFYFVKLIQCKYCYTRDINVIDMYNIHTQITDSELKKLYYEFEKNVAIKCNISDKLEYAIKEKAVKEYKMVVKSGNNYNCSELYEIIAKKNLKENLKEDNKIKQKHINNSSKNTNNSILYYLYWLFVRLILVIILIISYKYFKFLYIN